MKIITSPLPLSELKTIAGEVFGDMVKGVADLDKKIIVVGGELHADEEALFLDHGSKREHLWGFNIYVDKPRDSWLEFDSMINIRPSQGNRSRTIESKEIQEKIVTI